MSRFTIIVDVSSMTLWPSCWWRSCGSRGLFCLKHAHGFFHDTLKRHGELILYFAWVGWIHCVCVKKGVKMWWKGCKMSSDQGVFIWWGTKFKIFKIFFGFFGAKRLVFYFKRSNSYSIGQISIQTDQSRAAASLPPACPNGSGTAEHYRLARAGANLAARSRYHARH
jgi:hypothetical protein